MKKLLALVLSLAMMLSLAAVGTTSAEGEVVNVMYGGGTPEMRAVADKLRQRLIRYEARYGLKGGIVNGDFEKRPRYQPILYLSLIHI